MYQITLGIDGMMCGMCESHINDAVRNAFPVKKVSSSHGKGQTVILSETAIPESSDRRVPLLFISAQSRAPCSTRAGWLPAFSRPGCARPAHRAQARRAARPAG